MSVCMNLCLSSHTVQLSLAGRWCELLQSELLCLIGDCRILGVALIVVCDT